MNEKFEMVAKTFQGLEEVLAEELRNLGAENVAPGRRAVTFEGDLAILYKANLCCRTALRILKPFYKFIATDPDALYEMVKEYDWTSILTLDKTFAVDMTAYSEDFSHSRYATYRVKDAIVDYFKDRFGPDARPKVRLADADVIINVHISGDRVTLSLDSSGESLHKRGYRVAQTEAPINEVLAAGIILMSGWRGDTPFVDPMCGSGTFLTEAALIAANIMPGVFRKSFAFEHWKNFDAELLESLYNDDSAEREIEHPIIGADISPKAVAIARANIKAAGMSKYVEVECKPLAEWDDAPANGVMVTNPPYGERISVEDMDGLYELIGQKLKRVFKGYHAWLIGYRDEYFKKIGLTPSRKVELLNGSLECELREYVIFEGDYKSFRASGKHIKAVEEHIEERDKREQHFKSKQHRKSDTEWARDARDRGFGGRTMPKGKPSMGKRDDRDGERRGAPRNKLEERYQPKTPRFAPKEKRNDEASRPPYRANPDIPRPTAPHSDNPLASRRNINALKSIQGRKPSLPPTDGEQSSTLRSRRGWKRRDNSEE